MLQHPTSLHDAMHVADFADSTIWFSTWHRPQHGGYHGGGKQWFGGQTHNGSGTVPMELGAATGSAGERPETLKYFLYGKLGHLKKDCPTKK